METLITMPGIILVSGPKGSGKTQLIKDIIYNLAKQKMCDYLKVICPTAYNGSYDYLPKNHVSEVYNEQQLVSLLNEQIEIKKKGQKRKMIIILDDCIGSVNFKSKIWEKLATTC